MNRIMVPQQLPGCGVVGERIDDVLRGPRCCWFLRNVEMNDFAPFMGVNHQNVEQAKGDLGNRHDIVNPARCQPITVSGWKMINAVRQFGHHAFKSTQSNRSLRCSLDLCAGRRAPPSGAGGPDSPVPVRVWYGAR